MDGAPGATLGLRVDVDTFRGTRDGVPALLEALAARAVRATFFFSVGPDNMGRHVRRLLSPAFLAKMLRSRAPGLYGWDILLRGTVWPGPRIAERLGDVIRAARDAGHEIGLHAWDHHRWQVQATRMAPEAIRRELDLGMDALARVLGRRVECSAAAGWVCSEAVLRAKEALGFRYNSDCRGTSVFRPVVDGVACAPQVPVTLPTYDELIGRDGVADGNYNERLLALVRPGRLNVLAVHAEVEGIARRALFDEFLERALARGLSLLPLGDLVGEPDAVARGAIHSAPVPGRDGPVCQQTAAAGA